MCSFSLLVWSLLGQGVDGAAAGGGIGVPAGAPGGTGALPAAPGSDVAVDVDVDVDGGGVVEAGTVEDVAGRPAPSEGIASGGTGRISVTSQRPSRLARANG